MTNLIFLVIVLASQTLLAQSYRVVDQDKGDITVLRAFAREDLSVGKLINPDQCELLSSERRYNREFKSYNCAWSLANAMGGTPVNPFYSVTTVDGKIEYRHENTPVVEVHTLIPLESWMDASEIGFSLGSLGGTIHKYKKNQTREIQKVKLRDGRVGLVHKFIMPFQGNGGTSNCTIRTVSFKPFLSFFDHGSRTESRNWDSLASSENSRDYYITNFQYRNDRCEPPNSIDRQNQLLQ